MGYSGADLQTAHSIGWIPYWNLHPMRQELVRAGIKESTFIPGHPTDVNRLVSEGKVICAPASAVSLLLNPHTEIAAPIGVSSFGPIQSVYLGLNGETNAICELMRERLAIARDIVKEAFEESGESVRRIANQIWQEIDLAKAPTMVAYPPRLKLSAASASGAVLSKVFYRLIFGKSAYESAQTVTSPSTSTIELVIGDEALARRHEFQKIIDLGQFWKNITGLPFVFAIWQKGPRNVPADLQEKIFAAAEAAEAKMHVEPSRYFPGQHPLAHDGNEIDLAAYWKCINYRIDQKAMQGLLLYLCLARPLLRAEIDDNMVVKMLRWQKLGYSNTQFV